MIPQFERGDKVKWFDGQCIPSYGMVLKVNPKKLVIWDELREQEVRLYKSEVSWS